MLIVACVSFASLTPPAVNAVSTVSMTLRWTAPGDDGNSGRATLYDLRYSSMPITSLTFSAATPVTGLPVPKIAGQAESFTVSGLSPGAGYYFAIKAKDDAGNWSAMSNLTYRVAQTVAVDNQELKLEFAAPHPNPARNVVNLSFTLPEPANLDADVFDVTGRHLQTIATGHHSAGRHDLSWDLRDSSGRPVNAGVYLVRARVEKASWTWRVVVAR